MYRKTYKTYDFLFDIILLSYSYEFYWKLGLKFMLFINTYISLIFNLNKYLKILPVRRIQTLFFWELAVFGVLFGRSPPFWADPERLFSI